MIIPCQCKTEKCKLYDGQRIPVIKHYSAAVTVYCFQFDDVSVYLMATISSYHFQVACTLAQRLHIVVWLYAGFDLKLGHKSASFINITNCIPRELKSVFIRYLKADLSTHVMHYVIITCFSI